MLWDPQYELIALLMMFLFMVFYHLQRSLPLLKNRFFGYLIRVDLLCIITDLIASYISTRYETYPVWLMMISNMLYFQCMIALFFFFYLYCRVTARERAQAAYSEGNIFKIPFYAADAVLLINIFTGIFFTVSKENGYQRGAYYYYLSYAYVFIYILAGLGFVIAHRREIPLKEKWSIYLSTIIVLVCAFWQITFTPYILLVNISMSTSIAIMFLSMQNPEYDKDQMTRTYNRFGFERYVGERIRMKQPVQQVIIGFANFYNIRSIYGDKKMEKMLNRIGIKLVRNIKDAIPFYMMQGRFVFTMEKDKDPQPLIDWLIDYFSKDLQFGDDHVRFQLRIATLKPDVKCDDVFELEEALFYSIDKAIKNESSAVCSIDEDVFEKIKNNKRLRDIFHEALDNDSLTVYYQPIYDRDSARFISAEALVRIDHPKYGLIFPDQFIPIAEEDGSILRLGLQVFRKVCQFISKTDMEALGLKYIEINLSPIQCMHKGLADELIAIANEYHVDMSRFNFEITETAMTDTKDLNTLMNSLLVAGASFSLDDYGTGFSNLINILSLPFQIVKIDKSIVWSYFDSTEYILPKLTDMFLGDDLEIVAEGAETREMTEQLQEIGCRFIQGYYFSKPVSEDRFLEFIMTQNKT